MDKMTNAKPASGNEEAMTKAQIKFYQDRWRKLKPYHPGDDDPYSQFYIVREQRRNCKNRIEHFSNKLKQIQQGRLNSSIT